MLLEVNSAFKSHFSNDRHVLIFLRSLVYGMQTLYLLLKNRDLFLQVSLCLLLFFQLLLESILLILHLLQLSAEAQFEASLLLQQLL